MIEMLSFQSFLQGFSVCRAALVVIGSLWAAPASAAAFDHRHELFTKILARHVRDNRVDYPGLKTLPEDLTRYLDNIAAVTKAEFGRWDDPRQIAFLINAYNAATLRLVIDHYPLKSIKDIGSLFKGPWDQRVVRLFGDSITLNALEHDLLRKNYNEPRLHFALVCAAKGCPPLRAESYIASRLEEQLVDQAKTFLADPTKNRVDASSATLHLSPIFQWYASDFEKKHGSVLAALKVYWPKEYAAADGFRIRYTDYDWSLNE